MSAVGGPGDRAEQTASLVADIDAAAAFVRGQTTVGPQVGIVLGSGLGAVVDAITDPMIIPYRDIPRFAASTVAGHAGELVLGTIGATPVAVLSGRVHLYEGYSPQRVVFPVRVLGRLGAHTAVVTNASGGVHPDFRPRDVMVIRDQLNFTGQNPLVGPNLSELGPRFVDMTEPFDPQLRRLAHRVADAQGATLREGVYAGVLGPSYETPAEVRMLRAVGADAVGMSTVFEVIALRHMGVKVLGLSCITNAAAGLSTAPLSHEDVSAVAAELRGRLTALITETVQAIGAGDATA